MRPTVLVAALLVSLGTFLCHCAAQPAAPPAMGRVDAYACWSHDAHVFVLPFDEAIEFSPDRGYTLIEPFGPEDYRGQAPVSFDIPVGTYLVTFIIEVEPSAIRHPGLSDWDGWCIDGVGVDPGPRVFHYVGYRVEVNTGETALATTFVRPVPEYSPQDGTGSCTAPDVAEGVLAYEPDAPGPITQELIAAGIETPLASGAAAALHLRRKVIIRSGEDAWCLEATSPAQHALVKGLESQVHPNGVPLRLGGGELTDLLDRASAGTLVIPEAAPPAAATEAPAPPAQAPTAAPEAEAPATVEADYQALVSEGMRLKREGNYAGARQKLEAAIAADQKRLEAHWGLAWVLVELGERQQAAAEFSKVIELGATGTMADEARAALKRLQ